ncbi:MAG: hypothetical protein AAFR21_18270 [Pseudomonadota bacterium]
MNTLRIVLIGLVPFLIAACSNSISGRADRPSSFSEGISQFAADINMAVQEAEGFRVDYYAARKQFVSGSGTETDLEKMRLARNDYVYTSLRAHQISFQAFAAGLAREGRGGAFVSTLAALGLNAAGAINPSAVLAAAAGSVTGARESFNTDVLAEQTLDTLFRQMVAEQLRIRALIETSLDKNVLDYPLSATALDVEDYARAATIEQALSRTAQQAGENVDDATQELETARVGVFSKDVPGDLLRAFWKPDGVNVDAGNQTKIIDTMVELNFAVRDPAGLSNPSIVFFMRDRSFALQRLRVARKLGLI